MAVLDRTGNRDRNLGIVCYLLATDPEACGFVGGVYVQGYEFDFRTDVILPDHGGAHHDVEHHRQCSDYNRSDCICERRLTCIMFDV